MKPAFAKSPLCTMKFFRMRINICQAQRAAARVWRRSAEKIPADLPDDKSEEIRKLACDVFKAINASGVVRIDFMIDCDTDKVYANEINTIPGSLAFYLWEATGLKYTDMIDPAWQRLRSAASASAKTLPLLLIPIFYRAFPSGQRALKEQSFK